MKQIEFRLNISNSSYKWCIINMGPNIPKPVPPDPFIILEPYHDIGEFYVCMYYVAVEERCTADFEAPKLWKVRSRYVKIITYSTRDGPPFQSPYFSCNQNCNFIITAPWKWNEHIAGSSQHLGSRDALFVIYRVRRNSWQSSLKLV